MGALGVGSAPLQALDVAMICLAAMACVVSFCLAVQVSNVLMCILPRQLASKLENLAAVQASVHSLVVAMPNVSQIPAMARCAVRRLCASRNVHRTTTFERYDRDSANRRST